MRKKILESYINLFPSLKAVIKKAQHKIELQNFEIRKNILEYDDVSNLQRNKIYEIVIK